MSTSIFGNKGVLAGFQFNDFYHLLRCGSLFGGIFDQLSEVFSEFLIIDVILAWHLCRQILLQERRIQCSWIGRLRSVFKPRHNAVHAQ